MVWFEFFIWLCCCNPCLSDLRFLFQVSLHLTDSQPLDWGILLTLNSLIEFIMLILVKHFTNNSINMPKLSKRQLHSRKYSLTLQKHLDDRRETWNSLASDTLVLQTKRPGIQHDKWNDDKCVPTIISLSILMTFWISDFQVPFYGKKKKLWFISTIGCSDIRNAFIGEGDWYRWGGATSSAKAHHRSIWRLI